MPKPETTEPTPPTAPAPETKPEPAPETLAAKCIQAINGCGVKTATRQVAAMPADLIERLAKMQKSGDRTGAAQAIADAAAKRNA